MNKNLILSCLLNALIPTVNAQNDIPLKEVGGVFFKSIVTGSATTVLGGIPLVFIEHNLTNLEKAVKEDSATTPTKEKKLNRRIPHAKVSTNNVEYHFVHKPTLARRLAVSTLTLAGGAMLVGNILEAGRPSRYDNDRDFSPRKAAYPLGRAAAEATVGIFLAKGIDKKISVPFALACYLTGYGIVETVTTRW